jgi:hypothetical protein
VLVTVPISLSRYTEPRPSKRSPGDEAKIRLSVATGRTLRDVAAAFGISAERVRQIVRMGEAPPRATASSRWMPWVMNAIVRPNSRSPQQTEEPNPPCQKV